jgi:hypothetical protein
MHRLSFEFSNTHWCINRRKLALAAKFIQARSIHPDYHLLTAENTANYKKGFQVFPWTVNDKRPKKNKII